VRRGSGRRSGRLVELDRKAGSGDTSQRDAANFDAVDPVELEIEPDNRISLIIFGFANQRSNRRQTVGLRNKIVRSAPTGRRLDAADRMIPAAAFEFIGVTDLRGFQVSLSQQRDRHFAAIDTVAMLICHRPRKVSMPKHWRSRKQRIKTEVPGGRLIAFAERPARDADWTCMRPRSFGLGRMSADDRAVAGGKLP
jgi:hypothetical protein